MKRVIFALVGIGAPAGAVATTMPLSGQSSSEAAPMALHWNEASLDPDNKVLADGFPGAGLEFFFCWGRRKCPVHGQRLEEVRRDRRLGICRLHQR